MYNCFNRYVLHMLYIVILLILVLVSANMMGQVNDAPPMGDFSAFYDSGQVYQLTSSGLGDLKLDNLSLISVSRHC